MRKTCEHGDNITILVEENRRSDLISTACPIWWEMIVVIYMPKHQQGVELNKQGGKPRQRTGLGLRP
jgi:hypothetical protein